MSEFTLYWTGKVSLDKVKWTIDPGRETKLDPALEKKRQMVWQENLAKHPDIYDGHLLVLDEFDASGKAAMLRMSSIRFSTILTLSEKRLEISGYGALGFQAIILSPNREYILFGQRPETSLYCPLYYAVPGGMLEVEDAKGSFQAACMRELQEEARINLESEMALVASVCEVQGRLGVVMLIEAISTENPVEGDTVGGNEEWTDRLLVWHPVEKLETLDENLALEGLLFAKGEWDTFKHKGTSLLWP
jgi:ADP-ribose pyrophosphatase YjhB (NUDIX family)